MTKKELKDWLYKDFIQQSKNQLKSVYKQRTDLEVPATQWGGCWSGMPIHVKIKDVEKIVGVSNGELCPECKGWGCLLCCESETEIRQRQGIFS